MVPSFARSLSLLLFSPFFSLLEPLSLSTSPLTPERACRRFLALGSNLPQRSVLLLLLLARRRSGGRRRRRRRRRRRCLLRLVLPAAAVLVRGVRSSSVFPADDNAVTFERARHRQLVGLVVEVYLVAFGKVSESHDGGD